MTMDLGESVIDTATLQRVGGQMGSNPAGLYQDDGGRRYYVKSLESPAHARNERVAAALYQLAGAPTLSYVHTKAPDQIATEWVQLDKKHVAHLSEPERRQAQHWLGVHAWTANWDAAGFAGDNQGVVNGRVLTLDMGGALDFRAQGDPKGKAFGTRVDELDTLRFDADNPHAVRLFGDMSDDAIRQAVAVVTCIPDEQIRQVITEHGGSPSLADKMVARKADVARRLPTDHPLPLLYTYRRCPYAMRARMALLQAGRDFLAFEVVLRDKPAALLALSPKGTVPVLQLPDGRVLDESWDIMGWALAAHDHEGWWSRAQSVENLELLRRNDGEFKHHLDRYKYPERYAGEGCSRDAARSQAVAVLLLALEARLQPQPYLGGATPCATDLAIFPFVRQFAAVEPGWFAEQALPALQSWLAACLDSRLFEVCMSKLPSQTMVAFPALRG